MKKAREVLREGRAGMSATDADTDAELEKLAAKRSLCRCGDCVCQHELAKALLRARAALERVAAELEDWKYTAKEREVRDAQDAAKAALNDSELAEVLGNG